MPHKRIGAQSTLAEPSGNLTDLLTEELRSSKDYGQPLIYEQEYATKRTRVTVIWDAWADASLEERTAIILKAYEKAEGEAAREKIALASGLTVPEAAAAGMLSFQIISGRRSTDLVSQEQVEEAMIRQGASTLDKDIGLQLRFATQEEADSCKARFIVELPSSEPIWIICREVYSADSLAFTDAIGANLN